MIITKNGVPGQATPEEMEELARLDAESTPAQPTEAERIVALEEELAALKILIGEAQ